MIPRKVVNAMNFLNDIKLNPGKYPNFTSRQVARAIAVVDRECEKVEARIFANIGRARAQ